MTELKEIIEKEKQRDTVQLARMIYFYKEGGFMRAYDWSAWLWCKYIKDFTPTHRKAKQIDSTVIQIGCPVASVSKHLPDDATCVFNDDGSAVVTLPESVIPADADTKAMAEESDKWKQSFPVAEPSKKKTDGDFLSDTLAAHPSTITGIMQQLLAFPVEKKSMLECVSFLCDVKTQLAKII